MENPVLRDSKGEAVETRFGAYTILEHLGKGGMGDVYKAMQSGLERVVALKVLPALLARSSEFSERFFTEAFAISRLQHQNIVTIYDYGEENGQKYIAMQFIQGATLSKLIHDEKKFDYPRVIGIAKQISRGLKYAHQNEIVHRDIKSGNIMVEPGDKICISDFGIAKVIDAPSITTTGMAMGTPEYMAPEQCEGGVVDGQSDIYGLGCILFEMVTGKPPFLADTPLAVAYKQVHETPPLLGKRCPDVPPRLELIVAKCLKKSKAERYRTADDLLRDLDSAHLDVSPEELAAKAAAPSDKRITDRRGQERRYQGPPLALSRSYLAGILALFTMILGALAFLLFRPQPAATEGQRWFPPQSSEGPAFLDPAGREVKSDAMFDGNRNTFWGYAGGPKSEAEAVASFTAPMLITGMAVEAGGGDTPAGSEVGSPKVLILESEGHKPLRFTLSEGRAPQYLSLGGMVADKVHLHFVGSIGDKPAAVREVRFLGLPYE